MEFLAVFDNGVKLIVICVVGLNFSTTEAIEMNLAGLYMPL